MRSDNSGMKCRFSENHSNFQWNVQIPSQKKSWGNNLHCQDLERSWKVALDTLANVGRDFKQIGDSRCPEEWVSNAKRVVWLWIIQEWASFWLYHSGATYSTVTTPGAQQLARLRLRALLWLWHSWKILSTIFQLFCLFHILSLSLHLSLKIVA